MVVAAARAATTTVLIVLVFWRFAGGRWLGRRACAARGALGAYGSEGEGGGTAGAGISTIVVMVFCGAGAHGGLLYKASG